MVRLGFDFGGDFAGLGSLAEGSTVCLAVVLELGGFLIGVVGLESFVLDFACFVSS